MLFGASVDGVRLPEFLKGESTVRLDLGYNLPIPIRDLLLDDRGVSGTFSFRGEPHYVMVPWHAVLAVTDALGEVEYTTAVSWRFGTIEKPKGPTSRPRLKVVK